MFTVMPPDAVHALSLVLNPVIVASVFRKQIHGWMCHQSLLPGKPAGGCPVEVRTE